MSRTQKSLPSRIPFYFAARSQSRHATFTVGSGAHHAAAAVRSVSQEREAEQAEDLHAHDLLPAALRQLEQDLDLYNNIGRLVTFNKLIRDWVPWNRPRRALKTRPGVFVPVAASGFHKVPNFTPPLCPHAHNSWRTTKECQMDCYRETVAGEERWVFRARTHNCKFKVIIPPLSTGTKYVQDKDDSSDREVDETPPTPSSSQTLSASTQTTNSTTSSSPSASSSTSAVSRDPAVYRRLDNFDDYEIILSRVDAVGQFLSENSRTRDHPAADRDMPPPALFWFHPMSRPALFTHREFENSAIGLGMRTFNSADGVSPDAWHILSTCTAFCPGCRMMFSVDGFRAHTPDNRCSKPGADYLVAPSHVPCHPALNSDVPPPELLEFHPSSNPVPPPDYFATSMIGRALLEWNSCVGIPMDAWYTVITSMVYCAGCNRIRSFDGDCLHRDADGNALCGGRRLGIREADQPAPVFGKGKGRAL